MKKLLPDAFSCLALAALATTWWLPASLNAAPRTWSGAGTNALWSNPTNWGGIAPAVSGDNLIFTGALGLNNTNDYAAITNTGLAFNEGGFTLYGNPFFQGGGLTNSAGTNVINNDIFLTASRPAFIAGRLTLNGLVGGGAFGWTKSGAGELVLAGPSTNTGVLTIADGGGIVRVTHPQGLGRGNITLSKTGSSLSGFLQLDIPGINTITNTFTGVPSTTTLGDLTVPNIENLSGTNTVTRPPSVTAAGGNSVVFKATGGLLNIAGTFGSTLTSREVLLVGDGVGEITGSVTNGQAGTAAFPLRKEGSGTWTLKGTNLYSGSTTIANGRLALGATGSISNSTPVLVGPGTTFDVTAVPGGWPLGNGRTLQGGGHMLGNVIAQSGSTLQPGRLVSPAATAGTLTFSNNLVLEGATLSFNLSGDPTGLVSPFDRLQVAGNLTVSGVNTVSIGSSLDTALAPGVYPIIQYGGAITGTEANFAVTGFPVSSRGALGGFFVVSNNAVNLVVTGTPPANLVWAGDGLGNEWDFAAANWSNGVLSDVYVDNDAVRFGDTTTNFTVNLNTTVNPGFVVFDHTNNYTLQGGGGIAGANGFTKRGAGKLTVTTANPRTGIVRIEGGTLSVPTVANAATASPLGAAPVNVANLVLDGGTLEYTGSGLENNNRVFSIGTAGGGISVSEPFATLAFTNSQNSRAFGNALTKTGPGVVAWSFQQGLDGPVNILGGTLRMHGGVGSLFGYNLTTPVTIVDGSLDLNGRSLDAKPVVARGFGDLTHLSFGTTNGAIINTGAGNTLALRFVTLTGNTALGGTGRWDIRANPTAALSTGGNPYNLVKVGANQISIVGATVDPALGNVEIREGTLGYELATTGLGNPSASLTVRSGATLLLWAATTPLNKQFVFDDGSILTNGSGLGNTIVGPVSLPGFSGPGMGVGAGTALTINSPVSGTGGITKHGAGTLNLLGTNTYTGSSFLTAGKTVFSAVNLAGGFVGLNDGATLGVVAVGTNQMRTDTLNLGSGGAAALEFSALASTTVAPLRATNLAVNSTVTVHIASGLFLAGQTYPLLRWNSLSGSGAFVLGTLPPLTTANLVTNGGNTLALQVTSAVALETWTGAVNNQWDINTTTNWLFGGLPAVFANGNSVLFDDTGDNTTLINISAPVAPASMTVNNSAKNYGFLGSAITGTNAITKSGTAQLTLSSGNTYTGGTTLNAGKLNIDNDAALGTGPLVINAGTIDNTGPGPVTLTNNNPVTVNASFTFGGDKNLNLGPGPVTLTGNRTINAQGVATLTLGGILSDGGNNYSLAKTGPGTVTLTGANTYTGGTTVSQGTLNLAGNQGAANGGLTLSPNTTNGTVNILTGAVVRAASGKTIQVGNTSAVGTELMALNVSGAVTNDGTLSVQRYAFLTLNNGAAWQQNGDLVVKALGGSGFSPLLTVNSNATFTYTGANPIELSGADGNSGQGRITVAGGLFRTGQGFVQTTTPTTGFARLTLQNAGTLRLTAAIPALGGGGVQLATATGGGILDTAGFDTVFSGEFLGSSSLTKTGAGTLTFDGFSPLAHTGNLIVTGGTLALSNSVSLVSTGLLVGAGGTLDVTASAFVPYPLAAGQALGNVSSTGTVRGNLDATVGKLALTYAASTPCFSMVNGALTLGAATPVTVNNTGAALGNGSYKLIAAGTGGSVAGTTPASVTVTGNGLGSGGTAVLALTGSELFLNVSGVSAVNPNPTNLVGVISGGNLELSWPASHTGWTLQSQTNSRASGLSNNWVDVPGSTTTNFISIPLNKVDPTVFFRMIYTNAP